MSFHCIFFPEGDTQAVNILDLYLSIILLLDLNNISVQISLSDNARLRNVLATLDSSNL